MANSSFSVVLNRVQGRGFVGMLREETKPFFYPLNGNNGKSFQHPPMYCLWAELPRIFVSFFSLFKRILWRRNQRQRWRQKRVFERKQFIFTTFAIKRLLLLELRQKKTVLLFMYLEFAHLIHSVHLVCYSTTYSFVQTLRQIHWNQMDFLCSLGFQLIIPSSHCPSTNTVPG